MLSPTEVHEQMSFNSTFEEQLNHKHPLYVLAKKIDGQVFEEAFSKYYRKDFRRPAKPIRLMVSLLILKHVRNLSDESVVEQWSENAYYQYFSGKGSFIAAVPSEASDLVHFCHRNGEEGIELILKESIRVNGKDGEEDRGTTIYSPNPFPKTTTHSQQKKLKGGFARRAAIESRIGHLKSDHRLGRNFYKGLVGDDPAKAGLAAAAMNFKRMMNLWKVFLSWLWELFEILFTLNLVYQKSEC
jgi:IS5 family transposase